VVPFEELDEFVRQLHEPVVTIVEVAGVTGRVALEQRIVPVFLVLKESKSQRRISRGRPGLNLLTAENQIINVAGEDGPTRSY
jgi:hypothetical protein